MLNIFYKNPFCYKNRNGFSKKLFQINKKINLDKKFENMPFLNDNTVLKLTQPTPPPSKKNIDIFIFLSISYFMYVMFYYRKYKKI